MIDGHTERESKVGNSTQVLELDFTLTGEKIQFKNLEDFSSFIEDEKRAWTNFSNRRGVFSGQANSMLNLLQDVSVRGSAAASPDLSSVHLSRFADSFVSLTRGIGKALVESTTESRPIVELALFFMTRPDPDQHDQFRNLASNPSYAPAQALRMFMQMFGDPREIAGFIKQTRTEILVAKEDLSRLRDGFEQEITNGRRNIETLSVRAALRAPRAYWADRSDTHRSKARKARALWFTLSAIFAIGMPIFMIALFSPKVVGFLPPPSPGEFGWLVPFGLRVFIVGIVAGIAVWVLRQLLRDLRNHEHLAEDSAERVTMIETLSALQAIGLQESDLSSILSALYRPAAAAMAEDNGPVLPLEILLKGVADAAVRTKP